MKWHMTRAFWPLAITALWLGMLLFEAQSVRRGLALRAIIEQPERAVELAREALGE